MKRLGPFEIRDCLRIQSLESVAGTLRCSVNLKKLVLLSSSTVLFVIFCHVLYVPSEHVSLWFSRGQNQETKGLSSHHLDLSPFVPQAEKEKLPRPVASAVGSARRPSAGPRAAPAELAPVKPPRAKRSVSRIS